MHCTKFESCTWLQVHTCSHVRTCTCLYTYVHYMYMYNCTCTWISVDKGSNDVCTCNIKNGYRWIDCICRRLEVARLYKLLRALNMYYNMYMCVYTRTCMYLQLSFLKMIVAGFSGNTDLNRAQETANEVRRVMKNLKECQTLSQLYNQRERLFGQSVTQVSRN